MYTYVEPGDVFLTRGNSFLSKAIRIFTRRVGEERTKVNHVGIVVRGGSLNEAIIVEASSKVKRHPLNVYVGRKKTGVAIYRPININAEGLEHVVAKAETYVGRKYGYLKIVTHTIDWFLQGMYVARRLTRSDRYPICSWLVAQSFAEIGADFGVHAGAATPDDIWDFVTEETTKYQLVHPLVPLKK